MLKRFFYITTFVTVTIILTVLVLVFIVFPVAFKYSQGLRSLLIFQHHGLPKRREDFEPSLETPGLRNFYVDVTDEKTTDVLKLGVWHMLPWSLVDESILDADFDYSTAMESSGHNVFIYFHSSGQSRKDSVELFNMLRIFCHVISFDYRGFGDSDNGKMTESAIVNDCKQLCDWVMARTRVDICVWGYSLGASFAISTALKMQDDEGVAFDVFIINSAFTTLEEAIDYHPVLKVFMWLPWTRRTIIKSLHENGLVFDNMRNIEAVDSPMLIFHAADDSLIPHQLGTKLAVSAASRKYHSHRVVFFHQIPSGYGCDHYWINHYQDLPYDVRNFLIRNKNGNNTYVAKHSDKMILKHWVLGRNRNLFVPDTDDTSS